MNRFVMALLGAFLLIQPVVGYAHDLPKKNGLELKKKARDMRAKDVKTVKKAKASQSARLQIQQLPECVEVINDDCCGCYAITPDCFGVDADTTFVITEPGKYTLQQDVVFFPADEFTPAINILVDNVTLDLCEHTLSQGNDTPNAFGVQIGEGYFFTDPDDVLKNIEVTNGNIVDFTGVGVFCYNGSFDEPSGELAFEDLRFLELNILGCGASPTNNFGSGIDLDSAASGDLYDLDLPVAYKNVTIKDCNVNRCLGNAAITVSTADDLIIAHTTANDLTSTTSTVFEVFDFGPSAYLLACRNLQMNDCQGNNIRDLDPNAPDALAGSFIEGCINVYMKDCQFNDVSGESDILVGALFFSNAQNSIVENCQFNNVHGGESTGSVNGLHMSDGTLQETQGNGIKFINCQFNGMTRNATGEHESDVRRSLAGTRIITARNIIFENCQSVNIGTENPAYDCVGILVSVNLEDPTPFFGNVRNITLTNCVTGDITGLNRAVGIFLASENINQTAEQGSISNTVVENCIAERIRSSSSTELTAGIAEGLRDTHQAQSFFSTLSDLYIRDCRVSDVHAGCRNPLSAGILVESVQSPVLENNSVSDCDRGILFTGTNDIIPNGFQLAASFADATANPPVPIDIDAPVGLSQLESFRNKTRHNTVQVSVPDDVDASHEFLLPVNADLTALHWESGDKVVYHADGGPVIPGLVDGQTYYVIVYRPGFTERGLVQNNNVGNCSVSGYQDDRHPTLSAWINNMALLNGSPKPSHRANFAIKWPNKKPQVDEGTLGEYPKHPNKNFNTSLIFAKKEHHHSSR